jgi:hypothetical protein
MNHLVIIIVVIKPVLCHHPHYHHHLPHHYYYVLYSFIYSFTRYFRDVRDIERAHIAKWIEEAAAAKRVRSSRNN